MSAADWASRRKDYERLTFPELARHFDGMCVEARARGKWLFEHDPEYTEWVTGRLGYLARVEAGFQSREWGELQEARQQGRADA